MSDPVSSLFDRRTLTKDFYTLVPNSFLIFSVALILVIILYSNNSFKPKPYDMFCFLNQPKLDDCGEPIKTAKIPDTLNCPTMEELDKNDSGRAHLIAYIMRTSYEVTHNATNSVIHLLLQQIQSLRIIPLYVMFYIIIKLFKDVLKAINPFGINDLFNKFKKKPTTIIFDFMAIFMSVISLLFTLCFVVANVIYFAFIFNKLATAKGHYVKLIPILFVMLLIIGFVVIIAGIKAQGKKKNGKYNWFFFLLIAFGVPFVATCHTLGYVILSGIVNLFTGRFINKNIAADKDTYNKYQLNEKDSKVSMKGGANTGANDNSNAGSGGASVSDGPIAAAMVATGAATAAVAAAVGVPKKSMNPLSRMYDSGLSAYKSSPFKTQKGEDYQNFNFNKKARRIRKDALWFVLGLTLLTSVLAMLDSSTKIMKHKDANKYISKIRLALI
jgi:hypothetical protein